MKTRDYFEGTLLQPVGEQPGRIPMGRVAEMMDALICVYTVCHHVYALKGYEVPAHDARQLDEIRKTTQLTIPQAQRIFKLWYKWIYAYRHEGLPGLLEVQSFLSALRSIN